MSMERLNSQKRSISSLLVGTNTVAPTNTVETLYHEDDISVVFFSDSEHKKIFAYAYVLDKENTMSNILTRF